MASGILSREEKQRILKALEEDEEFRYAIAGKLGLLEILKRLDKIEEELAKLKEQFNKLYEKSLEYDRMFREVFKRFEVIERKLLEHDKRFEEINKRFEVLEKKLLEHDKRFEAIERKLLEHDKRFEAIERKLLEHDKRFEAIERKLLEHDKRFEAIERKLLEHDKRFEAIERKLLEHDKRFEAIERKLLEHDKRFEAIEVKLLEHDKKLDEVIRRVNRIELELGALTESFYSKAFIDDLKEELKAVGEKIIRRKRNARIDEEDIDLLIETDKTVYIVEVKVKPKHSDIGVLLVKTEIARKHYPGKQVVPILAGTMISRDVEKYAENKGVKVYSY